MYEIFYKKKQTCELGQGPPSSSNTLETRDFVVVRSLRPGYGAIPVVTNHYSFPGSNWACLKDEMAK